MKTPSNAMVLLLALTLVAACGSKEQTADAQAPAGEVAQPIEPAAESSAADEQDPPFEGEPAAPADEKDFADMPGVTAQEWAAAVGQTGASDPASQESSQSVPSAAASTTAAATAPAATASSAASDASPPALPALEEKDILAERNGQWATTAKASSTYGSDPSPQSAYTAWQATGAPNVPRYADHASSWASKAGDSKTPEWLEVGFGKAVHATSLRIRQNSAPGAISRIELADEAGIWHEVWGGTDTTQYPKNTIGWFVRDFPATVYKVTGARITLATDRVWGWNEIDAVQLVGTE